MAGRDWVKANGLHHGLCPDYFNKSFVYIQQKSFNLKGLHQSELGKQLTSSF